MSESMSSSRAVTRFQHSARVLAQRRPTPSQRYSQREYAESRRADELRRKHYRCLSSVRRLYRADSQGGKALGAPSVAADQVRNGDQFKDRQSIHQPARRRGGVADRSARAASDSIARSPSAPGLGPSQRRHGCGTFRWVGLNVVRGLHEALAARHIDCIGGKGR
jgi:hypothetical protein